MKFSLAQQIEEIEREIGLREKVYPNLVRKGEMRQSVADYHMARMRAVLRTVQTISTFDRGGTVSELLERLMMDEGP